MHHTSSHISIEPTSQRAPRTLAEAAGLAGAQFSSVPGSLVLTVIKHPGGDALLGARCELGHMNDFKGIAISRSEPMFSSSSQYASLHTSHVSRSPAYLRPDPNAGPEGGLLLDLTEAKMAYQLDRVPIIGQIPISAADLGKGVRLRIGPEVTLLIKMR